ncbi:2-iminobutanoate/2-iminopropanoate deaminase-like [Sitophilus oryzae]|uniref:2-iminobutanoate/2-iminopropanoate deaminase-like n=1 Tax=Sitophilus oryzae TaxID=7048 RepID=A0A6J2YKE4_SITOR|nr:2-iminobutanoate/2-iminopropanoate deaminase-like [Sitophilus oryzae]
MASSLIRKVISTAKAPRPAKGSPYNQAVSFNNTVFLSGVLGVDEHLKLVAGGVGAEAKKALESIGCILEAAGSSYEQVIKCNIMLNDINDFACVNDVYKEFFLKNFPARSTYQVGKLPMGASVEIEVIAAVINEQCNK